MNARELRTSELLGREQKAARLALAIVRFADRDAPHVTLVAAAKNDAVRETAQAACKYGHVSSETWNRVVELIRSVP